MIRGLLAALLLALLSLAACEHMSEGTESTQEATQLATTQVSNTLKFAQKRPRRQKKQLHAKHRRRQKISHQCTANQQQSWHLQKQLKQKPVKKMRRRRNRSKRMNG